MKNNKIKVLLVEDDQMLREVIAQFLELKKFMVIQSKNGLEADFILKRTNPDIIICDVSMPVMNGLQLLKQIRKDVRYDHVPFIFLTARADKSDLRSGMLAGADDYIIKPFTFEELFNSIQKRIERLSQIKENKSFDKTIQDSISFSSDEEHLSLSEIKNLSNMESKILKMIGKDMTSSQISQDLSISTRTVENHRYNICKKLKLKGSNTLTKFALKFKYSF
ncbi:MAG: response regulator transcription factor [Sphingobacterium thalpophilum]